MSISEKLTELTSIRTSMREKLAAKGIDASQHNFRDFPGDVESISNGGDYNVVEILPFPTATVDVTVTTPN